MNEKAFPLNNNYIVREDGQIRSLSSGKILKPCTLKRGGYLGVSLWRNNKGKSYPLHQVVAITFHGDRPSPTHHAAHNDGNKRNNSAANISWKTRVENAADKNLHGTDNRGSKNWNAKLDENKVAEMRRYLRSGICIRTVSPPLLVLNMRSSLQSNAVAFGGMLNEF